MSYRRQNSQFLFIRSEKNPKLHTTSLHHHGNRFVQNPQIHPQIPCLDIFQVEFHVSLKRRIATRGYLPQAGQSRGDVEPPEVGQTVVLNVTARMRPWSYQTHVTSQHVPELWHFIQTVTAQETANVCDTRVILDFEKCALALVA